MSGRSPSFLSRLHERATEDPERLAFVMDCPGGRYELAYGGLLERVQRLGHALRAAGLGDGGRVAICMENRPSWPLAYLATWYAAGVTVPLDPAHDARVLGRLLAHCQADAVITSPALLDKIREARESGGRRFRILLTDPLPREPGAAEPSWWEGRWVDTETPTADEEDPGGARDAGSGSDDDQGVIRLEELATGHAVPGDQDWDPSPPAGELGSLMYTSGTTGDPKGVMIGRDAVVENLRAAISQVELSHEDRFLGVLPLFHVLPLVTNCLGPLWIGARVVFLQELSADAIMAAFRRHRISIFVCVPAFFYRFHDRLEDRVRSMGPARRRLVRGVVRICGAVRRAVGWSPGRRLLAAAHRPFGPDMRLFVTGGAKMSSDVYEDFLDWGFTLLQGYGLTEATAVLTVSPPDDLRADTVGRPIPGVDLRIHEPGEDGVGEIWATGPSLMFGYYENEEATRRVMEEGWLRTGDLGRLTDDGHLQVTGRAKDVIVLASGKNIYPDELEEVYGESELVEELCLVGIPDPDGRGERLHAVVVPDMEAARRRGYVNVRDMVKWELETIASRLPGPQRLTSLEIRNEPLPRTPTRKVKRYQVLEESQRGESSTRTVEPGATEETGPPREPVPPGEGVTATADEPAWATDVRRAVARHAGVADVRREDHLDIDLGLDSLTRVELHSELQSLVGVRLGDEVAGEIHTVDELLEALEERREEGGGEAAESEWNRWQRLLSGQPGGVDPYLRRRPLMEASVWLVTHTVGALYRVLFGLRQQGRDGLPESSSFLICPNHASYTDPFFLAMTLPFRVLRRTFYVGYSEYFEGFIGRTFARWVRNVPIDANRNLERALQAAAEGLRRDMILVIFPEGGRSIDGEVQEFRKGAAILARHLDVPVVPVGIAGTFETWPRGGRFRPHPVSVVYGEPLPEEEGPSPEEDEAAPGSSPEEEEGAAGPSPEELNAALHERVVELLEQARRARD